MWRLCARLFLYFHSVDKARLLFHAHLLSRVTKTSQAPNEYLSVSPNNRKPYTRWQYHLTYHEVFQSRSNHRSATNVVQTTNAQKGLFVRSTLWHLPEGISILARQTHKFLDLLTYTFHCTIHPLPASHSGWLIFIWYFHIHINYRLSFEWAVGR